MKEELLEKGLYIQTEIGRQERLRSRLESVQGKFGNLKTTREGFETMCNINDYDQRIEFVTLHYLEEIGNLSAELVKKYIVECDERIEQLKKDFEAL